MTTLSRDVNLSMFLGLSALLAVADTLSPCLYTYVLAQAQCKGIFVAKQEFSRLRAGAGSWILSCDLLVGAGAVSCRESCKLWVGSVVRDASLVTSEVELGAVVGSHKCSCGGEL